MLDTWTPVQLYQPERPQKAKTLSVPSDLFSDELPKRLLLRVNDRNPKRPLVMGGAWEPPAKGFVYVYASAGILRKLGFDATQSVAHSAEVKRATACERLRYDRGAQGWLAVGVLGLIGDGFGLFAALDGPGAPWPGVVAASVAIIVGAVGLVSGSGAVGSPSE